MGRDHSRLAAAFARQAEVCRRLRAPWMAELSERCAAEIENAPVLRDLLCGHAGDPLRDALPLRLFGATHALVLDGAAPQLGRFYTATGIAASDYAAAWDAFLTVLHTHTERVRQALERPPQTNEVGRAAPLFGGFSTIAHRAGQPLRLFELGASAGLLQLWQRFRFELSGTTFGDPDSKVVVRTEWHGPRPQDGDLAVASSRGCDRFPVDVTNPVERTRLRSFVWADHVARLRTLGAALDLAVEHPPLVERDDAVHWTETRLRIHPRTATVLFHCVVWAYLADADQQRIHRWVETVGHGATEQAPLFWLRLEDPPEGPGSGFFELRLQAWPAGEDRLLARAEPHGAWVEWIDA